MISKSPAHRLIRLLLYLFQKGQITTREAATLIEADKRAALRDLQTLQALGPVRSTGDGQDRRWILDPTLEVNNLDIYDRIALELGRETTWFLKGSGLQESLERLAPDHLQRIPAKFRRNLERKFRLQPEPYRSYEDHRELLDDILDALLREHRLNIQYRKPNQEDRFYPGAMPLTLVLYRRGLYLVVGLVERVIYLAVERILSVEVGEPFDYPGDWNPDVRLGQHFGLVTSGPSERVVMRFSAAVAELVHTRIWHREQKITTLPDGQVELEMHTSGDELKRLALEWGEFCEVVEPLWLREKVIAALRQSAERYGILLQSPSS